MPGFWECLWVFLSRWATDTFGWTNSHPLLRSLFTCLSSAAFLDAPRWEGTLPLYSPGSCT